MKEKNLAKQEYLEMIQKSWTWGKLDQVERKKFLDLIDHPCATAIIKGSYEQRWEACEAMYHAFLSGLGYDGGMWRETIHEAPTRTTFYELNYKTQGMQVKPLQMTDIMQARRLAESAKKDGWNSDVTLTKVDIITSKMELR